MTNQTTQRNFYIKSYQKISSKTKSSKISVIDLFAKLKSLIKKFVTTLDPQKLGH